MKNIRIGILSGVLCLSLAACSGGEAKGFHPDDATSLLESGAFDAPLAEVDQDTACSLYGIDEETVTSCAVYGSTSAADELAIFTLKDAAATKAAAEQLQYRAEDRMDELADYMPEEIPKLENAVVETRDNTAILVIASDYEPIQTYLNR